MAEKRRFLDVWILETNTVYQEVPYAVVADWLQQGRLLDNDKMKPSGTKEWQRIGDSPEFRPFSLAPHEPEPQDTATVMEHGEAEAFVEGTHRRHHEEEDDDVDMIPLIDVTLVLLIFFMITATTVGAAAFVPTPKTDTGEVVDDPNGIRIDIRPDTDLDGKPLPNKPLYSVAEGNNAPGEDDKDLTSLTAMLGRLKALLDRRTTPAQLTINAHKDLKAVVARDLLLGLRAEEFRNKLASNYFGTSEKEP